MPLGSAVKSKIDIDFTRAQGVNSSGQIVFIPRRMRIGTTILSTFPITVQIVEGIGSVDLVRLPMGSYHVREEVDGRPPYEFDFALPTDAPAEIQYEEIAQVNPVPLMYTTVRTVNGVSPNPVTGDVEVAGGGGGVPTSRRVDTGTGLSGGGDLSANRTIALSSASIASLVKADTATQPAQLAAVAATIPNSPDDISAAPLVHTHTAEQITNFVTSVNALVTAGIAALIDSSPDALNTLNELAAALGDDPNFATTMTNALAGKAALAHGHAISAITGLQDSLDAKAATTDVVLKSLVDSKGDLIVASGDNTPGRLAIGSNGQIPYADSSQSVGIRWDAAPSGGGGGSFNPLAAEYGCKAISMDPLDLSVGAGSSGLKFIAMSNSRHYQMRVAIPQGESISSVRLPIKALGAGAGSLWFAVFQEDFSLLGSSADVASAFSSGSAETWRTATLTTPADATGDFIWITGLSTMDTGPQLCFSEIDNIGEFVWLLNTSGVRNAVRTEGLSAVPSTINPAAADAYLDCLFGVA